MRTKIKILACVVTMLATLAVPGVVLAEEAESVLCQVLPPHDGYPWRCE